MAPLKMLRECCSGILSDDGNKSGQSNKANKNVNKNILTSDKLLATMKENKDIIRKQELDTLIRCLKTLSTAHLERKEDSKAFDCYTQILKLAEDYNKDGKLM